MARLGRGQSFKPIIKRQSNLSFISSVTNAFVTIFEKAIQPSTTAVLTSLETVIQNRTQAIFAKLETYNVKLSGSLSFNGSNTYGTASGVSGFTASSFTVEGFFKQNNLTGNQNFVTLTGGNFFQVGTRGSLFGPWFNGGTFYASATAPAVAVTHHFACTYNSGAVVVFIDGVQVATGTSVQSIGGPLNLGGYGASEIYNGILGEVRISSGLRYTANFQVPGELFFDATTTAYYKMDELQGSILHDRSGNGNDITLFNSPTWVSPGLSNTITTAIYTLLEKPVKATIAVFTRLETAFISITQAIFPILETYSTRHDTRTNLIYNPSFEVNVTDNTAIEDFYSVLSSATQDATTSAQGSKSLKVILLATVNSELWRLKVRANDTAGVSLIAGQTYSLQAYVKTSDNRQVQLTMEGDTNSYGVPFNTTNQWQEFTHTFTAQVTSSNQKFNIHMNNGLSGTVWLDGLRCERAFGQLGNYFDGATAGASWTGTANNSTSTLPVLITYAIQTILEKVVKSTQAVFTDFSNTASTSTSPLFTTLETVIQKVTQAVQATLEAGSISNVTTYFNALFGNSLPSGWSQVGDATFTYGSNGITQSTAGAADPNKLMYTSTTAPLTRVVSVKVVIGASSTESRAGVVILGSNGTGGIDVILASNNKLTFLNDFVTFGPSFSLTYNAGETWNVKGMYDSVGQTFYGKAWKDGTGEPAWQISWALNAGSFTMSGIDAASTGSNVGSVFSDFTIAYPDYKNTAILTNLEANIRATQAVQTTLQNSIINSTQAIFATLEANIRNTQAVFALFQSAIINNTQPLSAKLEAVNNSVLVQQDAVWIAPTAGTLKDLAAWNSAGYLQLTLFNGNNQGEIEFNQVIPTGFIMSFDFFRNGTANEIGFYWNCSVTPVNYGSASGGYYLAFDYWNSRVALYYNTTLLAQATITIGNNSWSNNNKLYVVGNFIQVTFNGTVVLTYTDIARTVAGNLFGWHGWSGGQTSDMRVRNMVLNAPNNTGSLLTILESAKLLSTTAVQTTLEKALQASTTAINTVLEKFVQASTTAMLATLQSAIKNGTVSVFTILETQSKNSTTALNTILEKKLNITQALLTNLAANKATTNALLTLMEAKTQKTTALFTFFVYGGNSSIAIGGTSFIIPIPEYLQPVVLRMMNSGSMLRVRRIGNILRIGK
jgi:hypothetical protein